MKGIDYRDEMDVADKQLLVFLRKSFVAKHLGGQHDQQSHAGRARVVPSTKDVQFPSRYDTNKWKAFTEDKELQRNIRLNEIMNTWRSDFSASRAMTKILSGQEPPASWNDKRTRDNAEMLKVELESSPPLGTPSYRTARLTKDVGESANVGDTLTFHAAAVAFRPSNAMAFMVDELTPVQQTGQGKFLFEFPRETKGLVFDDSDTIMREEFRSGPVEAIVRGSFKVAKIEKRTVFDPLTRRDVEVEVHVLELLGAIEKHLSGKHDQSTHGRKRKGASSAGGKIDPTNYQSKIGRVSDKRMPRPNSGVGISRSDADTVAADIFEMTIKTAGGDVTTEVTDVSVGVDSVVVSGIVTLGGQIIGRFDRYIHDNGVVENAFFEIDSPYQGTGIGTTIMRHWEDQYARAGIKKMEVKATTGSGMNGAYTWAKYGYTPTQGSFKNLGYEFFDTIYASPELRSKVVSALNLPASAKVNSPASFASTIDRLYKQDILRLISDIPEFGEWLKGNITETGRRPYVAWNGSKKTQLLSKVSSKQLEVINRWMRTNPAGLENDDPQFWEDIRNAR